MSAGGARLPRDRPAARYRRRPDGLGEDVAAYGGVSRHDAERGRPEGRRTAADMARKGHLRVAGVIENMSPFTCENGETHADIRRRRRTTARRRHRRAAGRLGAAGRGARRRWGQGRAGGARERREARGSLRRPRPARVATRDRAARRDDRLSAPGSWSGSSRRSDPPAPEPVLLQGAGAAHVASMSSGPPDPAFPSWRSLRRWAHIESHAMGYLAGSTSR